MIPACLPVLEYGLFLCLVMSSRSRRISMEQSTNLKLVIITVREGCGGSLLSLRPGRVTLTRHKIDDVATLSLVLYLPHMLISQLSYDMPSVWNNNV